MNATGIRRFEPDPQESQPLLRLDNGTPTIRVMLTKAYESACNHEPTQDYLVLQQDSSKLTFALTDGVGQSFLGHVAAQMLANRLVNWMHSQPQLTDAASFESGLLTFLEELPHQANEVVNRLQFPDSVKGIVRDALERQRAYGSEAMFACGTIELNGPSPHVALAFLGNTHVRLITRDGQSADMEGPESERWSTRLGPRGHPQCQLWPASEVVRIIACSDGVTHDLAAIVDSPDDELRTRLDAVANDVNSDDIALVDIALVRAAMPGVDATSARPALPEIPVYRGPDAVFGPAATRPAPRRHRMVERASEKSMWGRFIEPLLPRRKDVAPAQQPEPAQTEPSVAGPLSFSQIPGEQFRYVVTVPANEAAVETIVHVVKTGGWSREYPVDNNQLELDLLPGGYQWSLGYRGRDGVVIWSEPQPFTVPGGKPRTAKPRNERM